MLKLDHIAKIYQTSDVQTHALDGVSMEIQAGEFVAVMGPSGCGKSTLLNVLGLLDNPSSGHYVFFGENVSRYSEPQLTQVRRRGVGFIFQSFNLIDDLNVMQNVEVSLLYRGISAGTRRTKIAAALESVGLTHRAKHMPYQLSGGQQQRVAIARALVAEPKVILADEPTGNLDTENGNSVMDLLSRINAAGTTLVMVTHSLVHAARAQRTIKLLDGHVVSETLLAA
jgi:putative ABC transport system ATP-binding protein